MLVAERNNYRDGTIARRASILRDAQVWMLDNHGVGVDIDRVAHEVGTSRRQLQRVFRELSDKSFRDTLAAIRMGHARHLLANTDWLIADIARAVGYAEPAQFSKSFRHYHGCAPRTHRRSADLKTNTA